MAVICFSVTASAQELTKKEKRAVRKELRQYYMDPASYVAKNRAHKVENEALQQQVDSLDREIDQLNKENEALLIKIAELEAKYAKLLDSMPTVLPPNGTVYQVQMGYYQQLDLVSFNNRLKVVKAEEVNGAKRYVIGYFERPEDALAFANDMKALGIDDAFVTQYVDGIRNMEFDVHKETE